MPTTITKSALALVSFVQAVLCYRMHFSLGGSPWSLDATFVSFAVEDGLDSY